MKAEEYTYRLGQIRAVLHSVVSSRVGHMGDHSVHTPQVDTKSAAEAVKACDELFVEGFAPPPKPSSEPALLIFDLDIARAKVVLAACAWCDAHGLGDGERVQDALHDAVDEYGAIVARIEARNKGVQ